MNRLALAAIAVSSFVVTARAQSLYAVSSNGTLWTVDATTGAAAQLANQVSNVAAADGLAYDPASDTVFMATLLDSLFTIDLVNDTSTFVGSFSPSIVLIHDIVWDSSTGTLYGASLHNNGLYKIDTTTAAVTQVGTSGLLGNTNLGYDSINDVMFATNSTTDSLYVVDRVTGGATLVSPLSGSINPRSLAFDNDTDTMYLLDSATVGLYSLDTNTGTARRSPSIRAARADSSTCQQRWAAFSASRTAADRPRLPPMARPCRAARSRQPSLRRSAHRSSASA